eukprot:2170766-Alexandrium_andersonii.AAC.1
MFQEPPRSESVYNFFQFIKHGVEGVSVPTQLAQAAESTAESPLATHPDNDDGSDSEEPEAGAERVAEDMEGV